MVIKLLQKLFNKRFIWFVSTSIVFLSFSAIKAQVLLIEELKENASSLRTCRLKYTFYGSKNGQKTESAYFFKKGTGFRVETQIYDGDLVKDKIDIVNRDNIMIYDASEKVIYKIKLEELRKEFKENAVGDIVNLFYDIPANPFRYLSLKEEELVLKGSEYLQEGKVYIFDGKYEDLDKEKGILVYYPSRLWIGDDGLPRQLIVYGNSGEKLYEYFFTIEEKNGEISDSLFLLSSEGVEVVDVTSEYRNKISGYLQLK